MLLLVRKRLGQQEMRLAKRKFSSNLQPRQGAQADRQDWWFGILIGCPYKPGLGYYRYYVSFRQHLTIPSGMSPIIRRRCWEASGDGDGIDFTGVCVSGTNRCVLKGQGMAY